MPTLERLPRVGLKIALLLFGGWAALLVAALLLEDTALGRYFFRHRVTAVGYLVWQTITHLAALGACVTTLVRGPRAHRVIVLVPLVCLVIFGLVMLGGPG